MRKLFGVKESKKAAIAKRESTQPSNASAQPPPSPPHKCSPARLDQPTSITDAAEKGDLEGVHILLNANPDLVSETRHSWSPLHYAAQEGHRDIAELLLANNADANAQGNQNVTPLQVAVANGRKCVVELLLAKGANVNAQDRERSTPLHGAASNGQKDIAELLLAKGADVNAKDADRHTPFDIATSEGHKDVADLLQSHGGHPTTDQSVYFLEAAEKGDLESIRALLQDHPDLILKAQNRYGATALKIAASRGHKAVVELLLAKGADIEATDNEGRTALHRVADKETALLLLDKGPTSTPRILSTTRLYSAFWSFVAIMWPWRNCWWTEGPTSTPRTDVAGLPWTQRRYTPKLSSNRCANVAPLTQTRGVRSVVRGQER